MKTLIVISGLPGTGKSTLSQAIAEALEIPVYSVDPIEAALWRSGLSPSFETGVAAYEVCATLAQEQLARGRSAIVDAVSPVEAARHTWRELAGAQQARLVILEVVCSDRALHRERVEKRIRNILGMAELTWDQVEQRQKEFEPWQDERLILDTANPLSDLTAQALRYVCGDSPRELTQSHTKGRQILPEPGL